MKVVREDDPAADGQGHECLRRQPFDGVQESQVLADRPRVDPEHGKLISELRLVDLRLRYRVAHDLGGREASGCDQSMPPSLTARLRAEEEFRDQPALQQSRSSRDSANQRRKRNPASWLFSGWNCTPSTDPLRTAAQNSMPWMAVPSE